MLMAGLAGLNGPGCTCQGAAPTTSEPAHEDPARHPAPAEPPAPVDVSFSTSDGVRIGATLRPPISAGEPIVILVHQVGSTRAEWAPLIERLDRVPRIASLSIDLRGHGESTQGPDGELTHGALTHEQWAATQEDVLAAVAFLRGDPAIAPSLVLVVGSSIGSTAAIAAASREPAINGVAALSPGRAYHGFDAITPGLGLAGRAFFAAVAADEVDGVETARALARITSTEAEIVPGSAHGVSLFTQGEVLDHLEAFVRQTLSRPAEATEP
jgi:pimeloyl-ACP methyl ester carboxylesterase